MFLHGLLQQLPSVLKDLGAFSGPLEPSLRSYTLEMAPYLRGFLQQVEDWSVYDQPRVLPNGDIILRRKPDANTIPKLSRIIEI